MAHDIQPLRLVFRWMMRGFSGHLPPEQLLYLWDLVIAYDSMEVYPLLAAAILSFRYVRHVKGGYYGQQTKNCQPLGHPCYI